MSNEPRLEETLDALPQHVLLLDARGAIALGNRSWRKFALSLGPLPELRGDSADYVDLWLRLMQATPVEAMQLKRHLGAVLAGELDRWTAQVECRVDGEPLYFELHAHGLPHGGAVVTHHEMTPVRALDRARARFEQLVDASSDAILIVDRDGAPIYANDAARRIAGALPGDHSGAVERLVDRASLAIAASEGACRGEVLVHTRDGAEIPVLQDIQWHGGAESSYFTAVLHDISAEKRREDELHTRNVELQLAYTQLKSAQDQLLQSEKMASIGQLAAGVAHEINNPIGYVHSNLGTLRDYTRSMFTLLEAYEQALSECDVTPHRRAELEALRQRVEIDYLAQDLPQLVAESAEGIERVRKIVQDLKDFSHVGHGDTWQVVDLHRGLDSTLNIVWNEIKYKAEIVKDYGTLPPVECLPSQINQVFLNLLVNAAQAIKDRGTIRLESGANGTHVWISISDNGSGIPESALPRIFDPFFTTKPVGQGTGLGLSLSYGIVKKHGGRIDVESCLGKGTTFRIVLPISQGAG